MGVHVDLLGLIRSKRHAPSRAAGLLLGAALLGGCSRDPACSGATGSVSARPRSAALRTEQDAIRERQYHGQLTDPRPPQVERDLEVLRNSGTPSREVLAWLLPRLRPGTPEAELHALLGTRFERIGTACDGRSPVIRYGGPPAQPALTLHFEQSSTNDWRRQNVLAFAEARGGSWR